MQKEDLQQISDLLDKKLEKAFKENDEVLLKKFDAVDKRFDAVDKRFDAVDKKFDAVDKKFEAVDKKFEAVDKKFDAVDKKFEAVDKKFEKAFHLFATKEDLKDLEERLDRKMSKKIDKVLTAIDGIVHKHKKFEIELASNLGAHDRFENKFIKTNKRVEVLEKKLDVKYVV